MLREALDVVFHCLVAVLIMFSLGILHQEFRGYSRTSGLRFIQGSLLVALFIVIMLAFDDLLMMLGVI